MGYYILRRLMAFIPTLLIVAVLIFLLIDLTPGDPTTIILGQDVSQASIDSLRADLGLDRPLTERLVTWFGKAIRGDLGNSLFSHDPVSSILATKYPVTISITIFAVLVSVGVGIPAGIIAAINQGRWTDWASMVSALVVLSLPGFFLALNLIYFFGVKLRWLPTGGFVPPSEDPVEFFKHLALPCVSLGLGQAAMIARLTRTSMLEVLRMDYIRTAQAKGLRQRLVIARHALKNALIPVVTAIGLGIGGMLGGSAITETVYTLPGVGRMLVEAIARRDYFLVQGAILAITVTYLIVNLVVDVLYVWVDPRISYQ